MSIVFRAVLILIYSALRCAFGLASLVNPAFKRLLSERDVAFSVRAKNGPAGMFRLSGGRVHYRSGVGEPVDFSVCWNGWGEADTWRKRLRLNMMEFLNTGMVTLEGDLSCINCFLMLLGEALRSMTRRRPAPVRRAEPGKERR